MAHDPTWVQPAADRRAQRKSAAGSIACIVFVTAMGAAFWIGAVWASQNWFSLPGLR